MSDHAPDKIHAAVREHYAALARQGGQSCCGDAADCCASEYPADALLALPESVTGLSLGCGNPVALAGLQAGDVVVDLGSGGGIDCFIAARQVGESGRVIGVDMTADMLARARANAARLGAANVEFRPGFIEALPLADGEATVVISNCVINLSPDKPRVFAEMFRVLGPGGRVAVSDIVTSGPLPEAVRASMQAWSACAAGALDVEDYAAGLRAAGFVDVRVAPKSDFDTLVEQMPAGALPANVPFSALITARKPKSA